MLKPDSWLKFEPPVDFLVRTSDTHEVVFERVESVLKTASGTLHLIRENGNVVEVRPPYLFYEYGAIEDDDRTQETV